MIFRVLVTISLHRYLVCMPEPSWRTVSTRKKHNVSAMYGRGGGRDGGRGGGRGRFGGRGGFGGRSGGRSGGRGGGGNDSGNKINGVDVSDPTRSFTNEEWGKLA